MAIITASPKNMARLIELQEQSLGEMTSIKELLISAASGVNAVSDAATSKTLSGPPTAEAKMVTDKKRDQDEKKLKSDEKLRESNEDLVKVQKELLAQAKEDAAARIKQADQIDDLSKGLQSIKSPFERLREGFTRGIANIKQKFSAENIKKSVLESTNIAGINNVKLGEMKYIKEQRALGVEKSDKDLKSDYKVARKAAHVMASADAGFEQLRKDTGGKYSDEELAQTQRGKQLNAKKQAAAAVYGRHDAGAALKFGENKLPQARSPFVTNPVAVKPEISQGQSLNSEEADLENIKKMDEQTDILKKIENNTAKHEAATGKGSAAPQPATGGGMLDGVGKTLGGAAKTLLALSASLWITSKALQNFADVSWGSVIKGITTLGALALATKLIKDNDSWKSLLALGGSFWVLSKGFQNFAEVSWSDVLKGLAALGTVAVTAKLMGDNIGSMVKGGLAIAGLGLAMMVAGKGFESFASLDWEGIGKGFVALLGLGAVAAVLGMALPFIIPGAIAIGALGLALVPFAAAMSLAGPAMDEFASGMERLAKISGEDLLKIAAGIAAIGVSMAAFGAGQAVAGLGNLVSRFLTLGTDSPVDQLIKIGQNGEGVMKAADGLDKLSGAMVKFGQLKGDSMKAINDFPWVRATAFVAAGGAMSVDGARVYNASKEVAAGDKAAAGGAGGNTAIVNAPSVTNNKSVQNNQVKLSPRNNDTTVNRYLERAYA